MIQFAELRKARETDPLIAACVAIRTNEVLQQKHDISLPAHNLGDHKHTAYRAQAVMDFFERPDPNYEDFTSWFRAVLEELFVIDAVALYVHPSRELNCGILRTSVAGLDTLDGATIRPVPSRNGQLSNYEQYIFGTTRRDLMDELANYTEDGLNAISTFGTQQLIYLSVHPRTWSLYGISPVETVVAVNHSNEDERKRATLRAFFVEPQEVLDMGFSGDEPRKALASLLRFLKTNLFDYIIQQVLGQKDLSWVWLAK